MQQPRQMYGLGSLVKSITKGVKKIVKSPIGKAAALYFAPALIPGGASTLGGLFQNMGGLAGLKSAVLGGSALPPSQGLGVSKGLLGNFLKTKAGKTAGMFALGTLGGTGLAALEAAGVEDPGQIRDVEALKIQLANGYKILNPEAEQKEVDAFVEANTAEYRADGGRIGYAMGSAEDNAMQASGIMGLPLNENPAGVTELDLRETGGFIPPVGVKEKADDIPAMLSNNEFVFTADAVRGMGGGDVEKGAQRLYDQMKMLEEGGRVA
jgi:hypothetical protein